MILHACLYVINDDIYVWAVNVFSEMALLRAV